MAAGAGKASGWTPNYSEKTRLQLLGKDYKWSFGVDGKRRNLHHMARNLASRLGQLGLMLAIPPSFVQAPANRSQSGRGNFYDFVARGPEFRIDG